jgi:hypothetical protein
MKKIDKTKININVDKLTDNTRKELFGKFISAGGKISNENDSDTIIKKDNKTKNILDRKTYPAIKHSNAFRIKSQNDKTAKQLNTTKINYSNYKPGYGTSIFQKFLIRFHIYTMDVTDFSGTNFNNKFFHLFNTEYKIALMGIKMLCMELFNQNQEIKYQIINTLDKLNPLNSTLIERISKVYNENEIISITKEYIDSPQTIHSINHIKDPLIYLFRKLYILKPFEQHIYTALEKSITLHMKLRMKKSLDYISKRKNLKDDMYVIFKKLFPALYWLFCKYQNRIYTLGSPEIEEKLNIKRHKILDNKQVDNSSTPEHSIPKINEPEMPEIKIEEKENEEEKEEEIHKELPDELKEGLKLLNNFNFNNIQELRMLYDNQKTFAHIKDNDKVLLTFFILKEFDIEYSFLLTTNKIKYKYFYDTGHVNHKEKLLGFYDDIKKSVDSFKEYSDSFEIFFKTYNVAPISKDSYITYTKDISALSKRREQSANAVRFSVLDFMNNVSNVFKELIEDIKGNKRIIDNPYDMIKFEISSDKTKKLNNKTISEALTIAYYFVNAFIYRLSSQGDLSGNIEFDENNKNVNTSQNLNSLPNEISSGTNKAQQKASSENDTDNESIIDEIDNKFS